MNQDQTELRVDVREMNVKSRAARSKMRANDLFAQPYPRGHGIAGPTADVKVDNCVCSSRP